MQQVAKNRRAPESPETWGGSTRFFRLMEKLFFGSSDVFVESVVGCPFGLNSSLQCLMILQCFHGGETEWGHRLTMRY